jgi:uncharacterized phage infection (PIP) family protein YhgE
LQGKWDVVSNDVLLLKGTITDETKKLSEKVDESQERALERVEHLFHKKFFQIVGAVVACLSLMFGAVTFLKARGINGMALGWVALISGLAIFLVIFLLSRNPRSTS